MLNCLRKRQSDRLLDQFIRYGFVGGIAFAVDFGLLYVLTDILQLHYLLSAALSFTAGLTVNYILSTLWVFTRHQVSSKKTELLIFIAIGVIGLGFNEALMWLLTDWWETYYLISKIVSTVLVYLWNFSARKYILYR